MYMYIDSTSLGVRGGVLFKISQSCFLPQFWCAWIEARKDGVV